MSTMYDTFGKDTHRYVFTREHGKLRHENDGCHWVINGEMARWWHPITRRIVGQFVFFQSSEAIHWEAFTSVNRFGLSQKYMEVRRNWDRYKQKLGVINMSTHERIMFTDDFDPMVVESIVRGFNPDRPNPSRDYWRLTKHGWLRKFLVEVQNERMANRAAWLYEMEVSYWNKDRIRLQKRIVELEKMMAQAAKPDTSEIEEIPPNEEKEDGPAKGV